MKKTVCILLTVLSVCSLFAIANPYTESMGLASIAMMDTDVATFVNPAQTYFYDNSHPLEISLTGSDNWGKGTFSDPKINLSAIFAAKRIAIGFSTGVVTDQKSPINYSIQKDFNLDLSVALGIKNFGVGLGVSAGSSKIRSELDALNKKKAFSFTKDAFFEEFRRLSGSEFVSVRVGADYKFKEFSIGFVLNDLFANGDSDVKSVLSRWAKGTDIGIAWQQDKFSARGRLKPLAFSAGVEALSVLSSDAQLNAGAQATLQLLRNYTISVRTGLSAPFKNVKNGYQILTVGAKISLVDCSLSFLFPYDGSKGLVAKANVTVSI